MEAKPMLNSPIEVQSIAADEFAKRAITRLDEAHQARKALNSILSEAVKPEFENLETDKRRLAGLVSNFRRNHSVG
jgi:hypothetical protein